MFFKGEMRKIIVDKPGLKPEVLRTRETHIIDSERRTAAFLNAIRRYANENNYDIQYDIRQCDESDLKWVYYEPYIPQENGVQDNDENDEGIDFNFHCTIL